MEKICVIGLWHQGVVGAACLADLGCNVIAADPNEPTVRTLQSGKAPLFEPGLDELLQKTICSGRLAFTTDLRTAVKDCPFVLIMFDTPVDENDQSDLRGIFEAVKEISPTLENDCVILVTAQVPVGTCARLEAEIRKINPSLRFAMAYSPENLQLGRAIERFCHPPLRVIGSDNERAFARLEALLSVIGDKWERVSLRTAEMVKHALNGYLAVSLTFGNELGNLCDKTGADGHRIAEILRTEPRVGRKAMLLPGLGFSGGTLARDMQTLRDLGRRSGVETPLLNGAWQSNILQNQIVISKLRQVFSTSGCARGAKSLLNRKITVLGLTYKPETSTLRRSIALTIIGELVREKALVTAHDPRANRDEIYHALGVIAQPREAPRGTCLGGADRQSRKPRGIIAEPSDLSSEAIRAKEEAKDAILSSIAALATEDPPCGSLLRRSSSGYEGRESQGFLAKEGESPAAGSFHFEEDVYQAVKGADALLLITGWKEYKNLDYGKIRKLMAGNLLIDAPNLLDRADLEQFGFQYIGIGQGYDADTKTKK